MKKKRVCEDCGSKKILLKPVGIVWRPDDVDNNDIPVELWKKHLDKLDVLAQTVFDHAEDGNFYVDCSSCGHCEIVKDWTTVEIRAWVRTNMFLGFRRKLRDKIKEVNHGLIGSNIANV